MATFATRLSLRVVLILLGLVLAIAIGAECATAQVKSRYPQYDYLMAARPKLPTAESKSRFPDGLIPMWRKALMRPDEQLLRMVFDTIKIAKRRELPGIDQMADDVKSVLGQHAENVDLARSGAAALIALNARDSANQLADLVRQHGYHVGLIVEPALAEWKSDAMKDQWLKRLEKSHRSQTEISMAIQGLAAIGATESMPRLIALLENPRSGFSLRQVVATAISQLQPDQSLSLAEKLIDAADPAAQPPVKMLLALHLIGETDSEQAIGLLTRLISQRNTTVQAESLRRLFLIRETLVESHAEKLVNSSDANVRHWCLSAMLANPQGRRAAIVAPHLDDPIPRIRRMVANGMIAWGRDEKIYDDVTAAVMSVLQQDSWRGCEQAIAVLVELEHADAGARMVGLLPHVRAEVRIAAAWGLKKLRLEEHLPAMLDHANTVFRLFKTGKADARNLNEIEQVAHLLESFGDQNFRQAEGILRAYMLKNLDYGVESRAAAYWSTGLMFADEAPKDLLDLMQERFLDLESMEPEVGRVRQMCAINFGRMNDSSSLPLLREGLLEGGYVGKACGWSIEQMTGEKPKQTEPIVHTEDDWFLKPLKDQ